MQECFWPWCDIESIQTSGVCLCLINPHVSLTPSQAPALSRVSASNLKALERRKPSFFVGHADLAGPK